MIEKSPTTVQAAGDHVRLEILDVLRGLAATAVCVYHFRRDNGLAPEIVNEAFKMGYLGVYAFFVVSGFAIPLSLQRVAFTGRNLLRFGQRRFFRLYPTYLVTTLGVVALWYLSAMAPGFKGTEPTFSWGVIWANLTLTADVFDEPWLNLVAWTLALEAQYYLAVALSMPLLIHRKVVWRMVVLVLWFVAPLLSRSPDFLLSQGVIFGFGLAWYARFHALISQRGFSSFVLLGLLVQSTLGWLQTSGSVEFWHTLPVLSAATALLTLVILMWVPGDRKWARPIVWVGNVSFSLYLVHTAIGGRVMNLAERFAHKSWHYALAMILAMGLSTLIAWFCYRWLEIPSHRYARTFNLSKRVESQPSGARRGVDE